MDANTAKAESSAAAFRKKEEADAIVIPVEFKPVGPLTPGGSAVFGPDGTPIIKSAPVPTSTINVTQHIRAGFGTDRFALEKAVHRANRQLNRLAGVRP